MDIPYDSPGKLDDDGGELCARSARQIQSRIKQGEKRKEKRRTRLRLYRGSRMSRTMMSGMMTASRSVFFSKAAACL